MLKLGLKSLACLALAIAIVAPSWVMSNAPVSTASAKDARMVTTASRNTPPPPDTCPMGPDTGKPAPGGKVDECAKYAPYDHPLEDPYDTTETVKVVAWGQVAHSADGKATLIAKQAVQGPIAGTQQVTFDLCAVQEFPLPDTGMVDILMLMGNEVTEATTPPAPGEDYYNTQYPTGDILIDNTNTIVHDETDGFLRRYLEAGACANVTVISPDREMTTTFLGFGSYETSSGVHLEGEYTRITPGGGATSLVHKP